MEYVIPLYPKALSKSPPYQGGVRGGFGELTNTPLTYPCIIKKDKLSYLIMWHIRERRGIAKKCLKLPLNVVKKYELWKNIVFRHGPEKLKEFPGFHDEKLKGERKGQRSSRLSDRYRVVYTVERDAVTVSVLEITPHKY